MIGVAAQQSDQRRKALSVQVLHNFAADSAVFDDDNLVSLAGLVPVMALAEQTALFELLADKVHIAEPRIKSGSANPAPKLVTVIAGMCAGADSIDDVDVVRSGGMKTLFGGVYAPSTIGTLLREFTFGHARQLESAVREHLVALCERVDLLPGREMLVPGAVALVRSPAGQFSTTYGITTVGGRVPVSLADHVRIGSITETWTGTVILQQAQEGKLSLGDPVSKFRPDVPDGEHITIAELLNMRSGLYNYTETRELNEMGDSNPQKVWEPAELLALAYSHPPYFPPGTGYHYSNTNTILLGLIAEALDAKPLSRVFQDRLFTPLGLKDTLFPPRSSNAIPDPHPQGYMYGTNVMTMSSPAALPPNMQAAAKAGTLQPSDQTSLNPSWAWAAGAGISTAADLATWVEALADGKLLNPDMQAERIASLQSTNPAQPDAPQYGLAIAKFGALYGHTGQVPGFNTFAGTDPQHKVTIVVWVNLDPTVDGRAAATLIAQDLIHQMYAYPTPTPTR